MTCATFEDEMFSRELRVWIPQFVTPIGHGAVPIATRMYLRPVPPPNKMARPSRGSGGRARG